MEERTLTVKQRKFCEEYVKLGNGRQAAIRAGYSKNSAHVIANENLNKPYIARHIQQLQQEIQDKTIADAIEIQQYLTSVIRGEVDEEVFQGVGGGEEVKTKKKPGVSERTRAAELMGRRYALFTDNINADIESQVVFVDDISDEDD